MQLAPSTYLPLLRALSGLPNAGISPLSAELFWAIDTLQTRNGVAGNLAEIGVAYGASALFLAQLRKRDESLYLNDLFGVTCRNVSESFVNDVDIARITSIIETRLGSMDRIVLLQKESGLLTTKDMADVRIFHIDGGHSFDEVTADLTFACKVLCPSGALVIDDMTTETGWRAVYYAVREFAEAMGLEKRWFVPHFSNKAVLVPDGEMFAALYGAYRDMCCSGKSNRDRDFNLAHASFRSLYSPSRFLTL
jgi:hypothetical protein